MLDSYIYGFERQRSNLALSDDLDTTEVAEEVVAAIPAGAYPSLARVAAEYAVEPFDDGRGLRVRPRACSSTGCSACWTRAERRPA